MVCEDKEALALATLIQLDRERFPKNVNLLREMTWR